ncbi:MAG: glutathione S-transferase family protein [bacterium]|nr:glutathione S-transferase family protein [bacterium]
MIIPDEQVTTTDVKSWKGLHLIHFQGSSCSQKVRILLREKGIDYTGHPVDLAAEKHVSPWFLGINPRGVVPILVHDGVVHVESNDILKYLDSEIPSDAQSFFPVDESERRFVALNLELEDSLHMDLRSLTMGFIFPRRLVQKSEKTLERWEGEGASNPKRALEVKWWRDFAREGVPPECARASVEAHRKAFGILEDRLESSEWLIGGRLSVLDIAWFITTARLRNAGYPLEDHPRLLAWHQMLAQRPAFLEETQDPFPIRSIIAPVYRFFRRIQGTTLADMIEAG